MSEHPTADRSPTTPEALLGGRFDVQPSNHLELQFDAQAPTTSGYDTTSCCAHHTTSCCAHYATSCCAHYGSEASSNVETGADSGAGPQVDAPGYTEAKAAYTRRLKRIEGQVRGIERMIAEDRYCIDVLTQISAIQSGLKAVALGLLDDHLAHCVVDAARRGGQEQEEKLTEVSNAIARLVRS